MRKAFVAAALALLGACTLPHAASPATTSPEPTFGPRNNFLSPTPPPDAITAHVTRVVDGDTIVVSGIDVGGIDHQTGGHRVRLIGIDTPEIHGSVQCFGEAASKFTHDTLDGKNVRVAFDINPLDRFGRALLYVWQDDGSFFNARLVGEGYAYQLTIPPDVRYTDLFGDLVTQARDANRGLWRGCPARD
jgi:micrococcal nuclease